MDAFSLAAYLKLDSKDFERGLKQDETSLKKFGDSFKKIVAGFAIGATVKKVADGVTDLTKQAVKAYANYEQLVGGVETLFGAGGKNLEEYARSAGKAVSDVEKEYKNLITAQKDVLARSEQAYKTAGMSMNDYMETVTSFSASLIQSLNGDTVKAAKIADQAIIDMSDNANKMGTSMEAIQNAYQGFAKQNYTMLDNLKLGYGGTKGEMERLIEDANKVKEAHGQLADLTIERFSDVVEAIHIIQDEMGITGTTAQEAEKTISGSISAMKASWGNLLVAIADGNGDIGKNVDALVETATIAFNNIVPVVQNSLRGIGEFLTKLSPVIAEEFPKMVEELLPGTIDAAEALIDGVVVALPSIWEAVTQTADHLMDKTSEVLHGKSGLLGDVFDAFRTAATDAISTGEGILKLLEDIFGYNDKTATATADFKASDAPLLEQVAGYLDQVFFYNNKDAVFGAQFNDNASGPIKDFLVWMGWVDPRTPPQGESPYSELEVRAEFRDDASAKITEAKQLIEDFDYYNNHTVKTKSTHEDHSSQFAFKAWNALHNLVEFENEHIDTDSEHTDNTSTPAKRALDELTKLFAYDEKGNMTYSAHTDQASDVIAEVLSILGELDKAGENPYTSESKFTDGTTAGAETAKKALQDLGAEGKTPKTSSAVFSGDTMISKVGTAYDKLKLLAEFDKWRMETYSSHADGTTTGATLAHDALAALFDIVDKNGDGVVTDSEHTDKTSETAWKAYESLQALFGIDQDGKLTYSQHDGNEAINTINDILALLSDLDTAGAEPYTAESSFTDGTTAGATSAYEAIEALKNGPQGVISDTTSRHTNLIVTEYQTAGSAPSNNVEPNTSGPNKKTNLPDIGAPTASAPATFKKGAGVMGTELVSIDAFGNTIKHARSMFGGTILRGATMFGMDAQGRPQIGGGEGMEAVVGVGSLSQMIRENMASQNRVLVEKLDALTKALLGRQDYIVLDTGELVGAISGKMDSELGRIGNWKGRGCA